jgi:hypothetical protein
MRAIFQHGDYSEFNLRKQAQYYAHNATAPVIFCFFPNNLERLKL